MTTSAILLPEIMDEATSQAISTQARDFQRKLDASLVMSDCGYDPDPWQSQVLRSTSKRLAILCGRQMGKSLTTACKAIHRALYFPSSLVLLISRSQDQSDELYRKVINAYNALDRPLQAVREMASEIELENSSRIVALPNNPDTIRGYSDCSLLVIDEASRVPDAVIVATMPMLMASSGDVVILSTPCGRTGYFYEQFTDPHGKWEKVVAKASDCPRFDPEMLADVARDLGPIMARQELFCEFVSDGQSVFGADSIDKAFESTMTCIPDF